MHVDWTSCTAESLYVVYQYNILFLSHCVRQSHSDIRSFVRSIFFFFFFSFFCQKNSKYFCRINSTHISNTQCEQNVPNGHYLILNLFEIYLPVWHVYSHFISTLCIFLLFCTKEHATYSVQGWIELLSTLTVHDK